MAMSAVASGELEVDGSFADIMGFCLQCRACEVVCPGLVPFGRAMEGARAEITAQIPDRARSMRHLILGGVLGSPKLMRLITAGMRLLRGLGLARLLPPSLRQSLSGVRPLTPVRSLRGRISPSGERGTAALLTGCVMEQWFPGVQTAAVELLERAGYRVVVPRRQTCCGALAAHDGAADQARRLAERNVAALAGVDVVAVTAAGCSAHMAEYGNWAEDGEDLARRSMDVTRLVADLIQQGALPRLDPGRGRVAVQDPCHLRHAQRETAAQRTVVTAAGYEAVDVDPSGMCCGAAGIYSLLHPEASAELGRRKASEVEVTGTTLVASANPGCEMQLRQYLPSWYSISHPVELYRDALVDEGREQPV
jgi:glycolate oxidase iron-sulfur subunit